MELRDRIERLLNSFGQDAQIYQEILFETEKMEARWGESPRFASGASELAHEKNATRTDEQEVDDVEALLAWRQERLQDISRRRVDSDADQQAIREELGVEELDAAAIRRVSPELVEPWQSMIAEMKKIDELIRGGDEMLIKKVNMEIEYMKLEMHRVQKIKKSRKVYQPLNRDEALFVDKNR
ncbi:MAG: hypothetical protein LBB49_02770 [Gracilibacteraceae bacterium]|jgi:hypothetical protein|nr:hypothetical protein [Gracilibacteraceae bacterium]